MYNKGMTIFMKVWRPVFGAGTDATGVTLPVVRVTDIFLSYYSVIAAAVQALHNANLSTRILSEQMRDVSTNLRMGRVHR